MTITDIGAGSRVRVVLDLGPRAPLARVTTAVEGLLIASVVARVIYDPEVEPTSSDGTAVLLWRGGAGLYSQAPTAALFRSHHAQDVRVEVLTYENPLDVVLAVGGAIGGATGLATLLQFLNTRKPSRVEATARAVKTRAEAELVEAEARKIRAEATRIDIENLTALADFVQSETGRMWTADHLQIFLGARETSALKALAQGIDQVEPL